MTNTEIYNYMFGHYNGVAIDVDGAPEYYDEITKVQCVDAFKEVLRLLGDPDYARPLGGDGYAHQIYYRFYDNGYDKYFDLVPIDYDNFPAQVGDILVYGVTDETPASHVSLFAGGAGGIYHYSFGQNQGTWDHSFNTITLCDYGVIAILRPKQQAQPQLQPQPEPEPKPQKNASGFYDVPEASYYFDAVCWAKNKGIITGVNEDYFKPEGNISRADLCTILWRMGGQPEVDQFNPFADVHAEDYYYKAVLWACAKGITAGTGQKFRPADPCTRAEAVTFLYRFCGAPDMGKTQIPYLDIDYNAYYFNAIRWSHAMQVTICGNMFRPENPCTRAQFVTMLQRVEKNNLI